MAFYVFTLASATLDFYSRVKNVTSLDSWYVISRKLEYQVRLLFSLSLQKNKRWKRLLRIYLMVNFTSRTKSRKSNIFLSKGIHSDMRATGDC